MFEYLIKGFRDEMEKSAAIPWYLADDIILFGGKALNKQGEEKQKQFKPTMQKIAIAMRYSAPAVEEVVKEAPKILARWKSTAPKSLHPKHIYGPMQPTAIWKDKLMAEKERLKGILV